MKLTHLILHKGSIIDNVGRILVSMLVKLPAHCYKIETLDSVTFFVYFILRKLIKHRSTQSLFPSPNNISFPVMVINTIDFTISSHENNSRVTSYTEQVSGIMKYNIST